MGWDGLNRRKFPRIVYPCLVRIASKEEVQDTYLTHTENIGVGGICVIVKREIKMFSPVELEIDLLEDGDNITAKGKVVWNVRRKGIEAHKPMFYDIGIEFESLKEKDSKRLQMAIDTFIKKGYKVLKPVY